MRTLKNILPLALLVVCSFTQFASYVPQYLADTPVEFIKPVAITQPIEQYAQFRSPGSTISAAVQANSASSATSRQTIAQNAGLDFAQANSIRSSVIQSQSVAPRFQNSFVNENQNVVFGSSSGSSVSIPDSQANIFSSGSYDSGVCKFPLKRINGVCRCPVNFRFIFGRCVIDYDVNDGETPDDTIPDDPNSTVECPVLKINRISRTNSIQGLALIARTFDGKKNNLNQPNWGSAGQLLQRRVNARYADGVKQPINNVPSSRVVSNTIGSQSEPITKNRLDATIAFTIFGQFVDHDIDLTPAQRGDFVEQFNIAIPPGDKFFSSQNVMRFSRSQFVQRPGSERRHPNVITSWIDASQVYGSSNATACALRTFSKGKLKVSQQGRDQFLPLFDRLFRAGDGRVLQNAILTSFHTIFLRQHNRLCDRILSQNQNLNDQTVFQIARNYVIGLLQKIVMKDFVPILLGDKYDQIIGRDRGYKSNINPNIPTEFSTASYRLGHALLINQIPTIDSNGNILKNFRLNQLFFKQNLITSQFLRNIMRGSSRTLSKEKSSQLIDDVRNLLVLDPDPSKQVKLDLFSLNIQRGRDHGLPSYNQARSVFGLKKINTFQQLLPNDQIDVAKKLKSVYGTPDNMQLFIGIISEKPVPNGIVGELGAQIVGQTFRNLRDADRLWYERTYPKSIINQIQNTQLGDIVRRNTGATDIPSNIFIRS